MPLRPVTDPALLEQLEASPPVAAAPAGLKPVADPALLEQLNAPEPIGDFRDQYAGQGVVEGNLNYAKDYGKGIVDSAKQLPRDPLGVGIGETALHLATGAASPLFGAADWALGKLGMADPKNPTGSYAGARDKYVYEPRTPQGKATAGLAGAVMKPVGDAFSVLGTESGDIAKQMGASDATAQDIKDMAPDAAGLALGMRATRKPSVKPAAAAKVAEVIPTKDAITEAAHAAYKKAEDAGVKVAPDHFDKLKNGLSASMRKEGINQTLHPDASAALKEIIDTKEAPTLLEIERLRRIAQDAEGSIKPADARLAGELVDHIDDFVEQIGDPGFKEARGLWARKRKTDTIDELFRRAELSENNYSSSGLENAIRSEFRGLAKNERRMKRFNAEERAAIEQVAKGSKLDNALRQVGKFAPTDRFGQVTALLATMANPIGAVLPVAGMGARAAATKATMKNANRAHEIVRRGPIQQQVKAPPAQAPAEAMQAQAMVQALEAEAQKRGLFDSTTPTPMRAAAEADWQKRYALAKALSERSVAQ